MADEKFNKAKEVFDRFCEALTEKEWRFRADEENLNIHTGAVGDDLPMEIMIDVNAERQLLLVISRLPLTVPEDKRIDFAIAINVINNGIVDGSFDYDIKSGSVYFRLTSSFLDSRIGKEAMMYMLLVSCSTIDDYNDKLLMISKGLLSLEDFMKSEIN